MYLACEFNQYACREMCISETQQCDGVYDCADMGDEVRNCLGLFK